MKKENDRQEHIEPEGPSDGDLRVEMDEEEGALPEQKLKSLRNKLRKAESERGEYLAGWQRAKADFVNLKRESEAARKDYVALANERMIEELLPTLESFNQAFRNKEAWEKVDKNWRVGVEYIYNQLLETLKRHGFSFFGAAGEDFSPDRHVAAEAIETSDEAKDGTVAEVIQEGVSVGGRVIRPARVKIFKAD